MSDRVYTVPFSRQSISAVQGLIEVTAATGRPLRLLEVYVENTDSEVSEQLPIELVHGDANTTSGSGGSSVTPVKTDQNDPAAGFSAERNNTTRLAVGTGTLTTITPRGWNILSGHAWRATPKTEIRIKAGERLELGLPVAPGAAREMSGHLVIQED